MRRWVGEKFVKSLKAFSYTVENEDFEATVEVDRNHIEDDQLGIYTPQAQIGRVFSQAVARWKSSLSCVSNKGTAVLSIATQAAAKASYGAARTAMRKFKDDEGRPLDVNPNILLVGPGLEDTAKALLTADRLEDGKVNLYKGTAELVVSTRITSDTAWFLLDASKPVRPFIYQERKAPVFVQQTDPEADDVFNRKKFKFGAEARAAGGYGFWQLAFGEMAFVAAASGHSDQPITWQPGDFTSEQWHALVKEPQLIVTSAWK
ncbi:hypothetical protein L1887_59946 [Cichorium endivia]|nr:hypothetical protein L1887_59946 [Cichorium endivia]